MQLYPNSDRTPTFSISCPTRGRPQNVRRFIESIRSTSDNFNDLEILFYVDDDDDSFPDDVLSFNIRKITGKRVWITLAHNILYSNSKGEIILYIGDDAVFKTTGWDSLVKKTFDLCEDKILLVYANDNGWYGSKLATQGFVHKKWVEALGYFAFPGRTSSMDRWFDEVAKKLNRATYLESIVIEHVHYRQGKASAEFDKTYQEAYEESLKWGGYLKHYRKLKYERRIDRIILGDIMIQKPKIEAHYIIGELLVKLQNNLNFSIANRFRLLSLNNFEIFPKIFINMLKVIFHRRVIRIK
jgi:hypothetical protein